MSEQLDELKQRLSELRSQGDIDATVSAALEVVDCAREEAGEHSLPYAEALDELACIQRDIGDFAPARQAFELAASILADQAGDASPRYAAALTNLAGLHRMTGELDRAASIQRRCVDIYRSALGDGHLLTLSARNNLGAVLRDQGKLNEARAMLEQCIDAIDDPNRAEEANPHAQITIGHNLAAVYMQMNEHANAADLFARVLVQVEAAMGSDHPVYLSTLEALAAAQLGDGQRAQAADTLERLAQHNERLYGADSPPHRKAVEKLAQVRR